MSKCCCGSCHDDQFLQGTSITPASANGDGDSFSVLGYPAVSFEVFGTMSGATTVNFEFLNGTTWEALPVTNQSTGATGSTAIAAGRYLALTAGIQVVRARISAIAGGDTVRVVGHAVCEVGSTGSSGGGGGDSNATIVAPLGRQAAATSVSVAPDEATFDILDDSLDNLADLNIKIGDTTNPAVSTDADGTVSAKLRGIIVNLISLLARFPATLGRLAAAASLSVVLSTEDKAALDAISTSTGTTTVPVQVTKTVAAIATPEALAADGTFFRTATLVGKKAARTNNVGIVYLGIGSTNDTQALEIAAGQVVSITAPTGQRYDLNDWYLDVLNAGDGVIIIYS